MISKVILIGKGLKITDERIENIRFEYQKSYTCRLQMNSLRKNIRDVPEEKFTTSFFRLFGIHEHLNRFKAQVFIYWCMSK